MLPSMVKKKFLKLKAKSQKNLLVLGGCYFFRDKDSWGNTTKIRGRTPTEKHFF